MPRLSVHNLTQNHHFRVENKTKIRVRSYSITQPEQHSRRSDSAPKPTLSSDVPAVPTSDSAPKPTLSSDVPAITTSDSAPKPTPPTYQQYQHQTVHRNQHCPPTYQQYQHQTVHRNQHCPPTYQQYQHQTVHRNQHCPPTYQQYQSCTQFRLRTILLSLYPRQINTLYLQANLYSKRLADWFRANRLPLNYVLHQKRIICLYWYARCIL